MIPQQKHRKYTVYLGIVLAILHVLKKLEPKRSAIWSRIDTLEDRVNALLDMIPGNMDYQDIDDSVEIVQALDDKAAEIAERRKRETKIN